MRLRDLKIHLPIAVNVTGNDVLQCISLLGAPYRPASLVALDADENNTRCVRFEPLRTPVRPPLRNDRVPLRIDDETCCRY
jgi:hypothetical protein